MIKFLYLFFAVTMKGTVDQINNGMVFVELTAKDGHTHEETLPQWVFPCNIEEGTVFWIDSSEKVTTIRCERKDNE